MRVDAPGARARHAGFAGTFVVPAGSYEFKVALNDGWDENYGAGGQAGGANLPLVVAGPVSLLFAYDHGTHAITLSPTDLPRGQVTQSDRALASSSLRNDLTRERFYFVMTDRFANGSSANDLGGYASAAPPVSTPRTRATTTAVTWPG